MIPKEIQYNLHFDEVRGDVLRSPQRTWHQSEVTEVKWKSKRLPLETKTQKKRNTVCSRYLEVHGTLCNTSRYPYLDMSDLQKCWKNKSNNKHIVQMII